MTERKGFSGVGGVVLACLVWTAFVSPAAGQQILLDKPVRAGDVNFFPDLNDEDHYYYVPTRASLALHESGKPQFSLLRYVENVRSGAGEAEARQGEGGGILHAVVRLGLTEDELETARRELQRLKPGASVEGPVLFRSGKFGLVTSFTDPDGKLSAQVVGLGNAPILEGGKAAISMHLTKRGAKLLWESFQSATPDISFTFDMELAGFQSPKRAVLEANFEQIYAHQKFSAAVATPMLAAEINQALEDLRQSGAIKITQVGDDEDFGKLIDIAYRKITDIMFQPVGGGGAPSLAGLSQGAGGQTSLLDKVNQKLADSRKEAREENAQIREERGEFLKQSGQRADALAQRSERLDGLLASLEGKQIDPEVRELIEAQAAYTRTLAATARRSADGVQAAASGDPTAGLREEVPVPSFAALAVYEMKKTRHTMDFKVDLNKYTADTLPLRFDENIGDLRRFMKDPAVFRNVNLDDPLFKQREIVAFVDGLNAEHFTKYVNFVSVQLRKKHEGGDETYDEVRIDRSNFSAVGNNFKLLYGWKGDDDRSRWRDYEYRATWSFFGGNAVEQPWRRTNVGSIALEPPYQRRFVELEGDSNKVKELGVSAILVDIFYELGGEEKSERVVLRPAQGQLSEQIEFMLPPGETTFEYEIKWRLPGNRTVDSGRQTTDFPILSVDSPPEV